VRVGLFYDPLRFSPCSTDYSLPFFLKKKKEEDEEELKRAVAV
jgi:hypothetical protein